MTITIKAKDLVPGDLVDLERDKYADPKGEHGQFQSEFATVASVDHETPECVAVGFEGFDVVGFPVDHELEVEAVPVIFRKWPATREKYLGKMQWIKGDVIALFPTIPGTHEDHTFSSFQHVGQHGAADAGLIHRTKAATPEEYADLKAELEAAPYNYRLKVYSRMQRGWDKERRAELRRMGGAGSVA